MNRAVSDVAATLVLSVKPDFSITIEKARKELINRLGENIQIRRIAMLTSKSGIVGCYTHGRDINSLIGRIGVLVSINVNNATLAKDIAMHIAASNPKMISAKQVSTEFLKKREKYF